MKSNFLLRYSKRFVVNLLLSSFFAFLTFSHITIEINSVQRPVIARLEKVGTLFLSLFYGNPFFEKIPFLARVLSDYFLKRYQNDVVYILAIKEFRPGPFHFKRYKYERNVQLTSRELYEFKVKRGKEVMYLVSDGRYGINRHDKCQVTYGERSKAVVTIVPKRESELLDAS